jgi:hypothetical protein
MRKGTKIALAAGVIAIVGAAGISSMAIAEYRGTSGWGHHGMGHKGGGMHGRGHHGMGHKGRGMHSMLERFDTNQDSKLTQEELDGARTKLLGTYDADKDGKLSLAEYEKLWLEAKRRKMVRSFQRKDKDGDASITLDEFLKPYSKLVERLDRNEDGVLSREDHHKRGWRGRGHHMDGGHHRGHHRGHDGDDKKPGMNKHEG